MKTTKIIQHPSPTEQKEWPESIRKSYWQEQLRQSGNTKTKLGLCRYRGCYEQCKNRSYTKPSYCSHHQKTQKRRAGNNKRNYVRVVRKNESLIDAVNRHIDNLRLGVSWPGSCSGGYPQIRSGRKKKYVHVLSYEIHHGPTEPQSDIHHLDANKENFLPENLVAIPSNHHIALHRASQNNLISALKSMTQSPTPHEAVAIRSLGPFDSKNRVGTFPAESEETK